MPAPHRLMVVLRQRRKQLRRTRKVVAAELGVRPDTLGAWELGNAYPMLLNAAAYANAVALRLAVVDTARGRTLSSDPATLIKAAVEHRIQHEVSLGEMAKRLGKERERIRLIESGDPSALRLLTVEEYIEALGLSLLLVFDRPRCCVCDPWWCRTDESGEHCAERSCGRCLHGCPAPDGECCEAAEPARAGS
ncbi:helix-turn-helix domain-containing protein [Microbispora sp. CA-102843]|uniref:helix-turn-helix domain-containing protein n=1 Tax=Microbispora sp. CA-102843 TaxID=3239952 RepID=UPI003D8D4D25